MSVDPMSHAMLAVVTWLYFTRHYLLLPALFLALVTKESFTFVGIIMIAAEILHAFSMGSKKARQSCHLIAGIIGALLAHKIAIHIIELHWFPPTNNYGASALGTILYFWREAKQEPARFVVWLTAITCVVGTFPILWLKPWKVPANATDRRNAAYLLLGCAGFMALGLVGGSDMSRIIFTGNLLVIGAMLLPMNGRLPPTWHTGTALGLSLLLALTYTKVLPSTLEYDYYTQGHRVAPTLSVLAAGLGLMVIGAAVTRLKGRAEVNPSSP